MLQVLLTVATLSLMVFALVDIITGDESQVKYLGKFGWVIVVILLPIVGSVLWLAIGKERVTLQPGFGRPGESRAHPAPRPDDRSGRDRGGRDSHGARDRSDGDERGDTAHVTADDDNAIEDEIAFHEKQAQIRRLEAELQARRDEE